MTQISPGVPEGPPPEPAPGSTAAGPDARVLPTRVLATVWFTLFLDLVGFGMILPVLPFYASHHGASPAVVALLSTSFSIAQFVMSPVLGRLSDRIGRRPVMLVSVAGSCSAMLLLGFAQSLAMVFAARIVSGMANSNVSTANAYVADRVAPDQRARYMGMMGSAIGLGFIFGPALGGLLSTQDDPHRPFLVAAGLAAVNWLMAFAWLPESEREPAQADEDRPLFVFRPAQLRRIAGTQLGWLVAVNFTFFFAFAAMESTFALFTEARYGWTARETGYVFTEIGVVIVFVQGIVVGRVVRRFGERGALICGLLVLTAGLAMTGASHHVAMVAIAAALIAGGNGLVTPTVNALVSRKSSAGDQGLNLGLCGSAGSLARISGPMVAGPLFELRGEGVPFLLGAVMAMLAAVMAWARIRGGDD